MRRRLIFAAVIVNLFLAFALLRSPAVTQVWPFSAAFQDCCKNEGTPSGYCCEDCCFFVSDCDDDEDCQDS